MRTPFDIFDTPVLRLSDIRARRGQSPHICDSCIEGFQLALVRRGAFLRRVHDDYLVSDTTSAALFEQGDPYQLEPFGGLGAQCTILSFNEDVLPDRTRDELMRRRRLPLPPSAAVAAQRLFLGVTQAKAAALVVEEIALGIAMEVSGAGDRHRRTPSRSEHRVAEDVRELIAASPLRPYSLSTIAREFNISPYHLAHVFKTVTGSSIGRYQMRLRLNLALDSIARGERNLSAVALGFGFASHSHFTRLFRREFGVAPSAARALIAAT